MRGVRAALLVAVTVLFGAGCALLPNGRDEADTRVFVLAPGLQPALAAAPGACGILELTTGRAAGGHRTGRMAYMRNPYQLEYFAYAVWADTPVRLIGQQLLQYLEDSQAFEAVIPSPVSVATALRLELAGGSVLQRFDDSGSTLEIALEARLFGGDRRVQTCLEELVVLETRIPHRAVIRLVPHER